MELNEREKAIWLAALFDGEGNLYFDYTSQDFKHDIHIAQWYCDALLQTIKERAGMGRIMPGNGWIISSKDEMVAFLDLVEPYLIVKKSMVPLARALLNTIGIPGRGAESRTLLLRAKLLEKWEEHFSQKANTKRRRGSQCA